MVQNQCFFVFENPHFFIFSEKKKTPKNFRALRARFFCQYSIQNARFFGQYSIFHIFSAAQRKICIKTDVFFKKPCIFRFVMLFFYGINKTKPTFFQKCGFCQKNKKIKPSNKKHCNLGSRRSPLILPDT